MRACQSVLTPLLMLLASQGGVSFLVQSPVAIVRRSSNVVVSAETVEVCGFKDCRRAGGGARLEKLVKEVLDEKGLTDLFTVEGCDCQGECGYGPNVVVDGRIINDVKGKDAVVKALGIE